VAVLQVLVQELEQVAPQVVLHVQVQLAVAVKLRVLLVEAESLARLASQSAHVVKSSTISQPQSLVVCRFNSVAVQPYVYLAVHHLQTLPKKLALTQQLW
jgi:hypothetical protein